MRLRLAALVVWVALAAACLAVFGFTVEALVNLLGCAVIVAVSVTDLERRIVPNRIVLPALAVALVVQTIRDPSVEWVVAALGAGGFFLVLALVYPAGLGMGDVKLAAFFGPIRAMVWATAVLIASGGVLGGLNTMYAAFASRVREVGALQAMGFARRAIVVSLVQESLVASAAGALLAAGLGLLLLDGLTVPFSAGVFGLVVDAPVLATGLAGGLLLGLVGALPPALRCLRLPITDALKSQ